MATIKHRTLTGFEASSYLYSLCEKTITYRRLIRLLVIAHMVHLGRYNKPLMLGQFSTTDSDIIPPCRSLSHHDIDFRFCNQYKTLKDVFEYFKNDDDELLKVIMHIDNGVWYTYHEWGKVVPIPNEGFIKHYQRMINPSHYA